MLRDEQLQLAGPINLIAAIWCAELAAHALAIWPSSPLLWYLNLEVFQSFRYGFAGASEWLGGANGLAQSICVSVGLLGLVCTGLIAKIRLPLAIASNLSFAYSAVLLCCAFVADESRPWPGFSASGLRSPSCCLAAAILVISFLSSTVSHRSYWREIFS